MATTRQVSRDYAARIKRAHRTLTESRSPYTQSQFETEVRAILRALDGLTFENGQPLDLSTKEEILNGIDQELGSPTGTFVKLRESSVANLLAFQQLLAQITQNISFGPP